MIDFLCASNDAAGGVRVSMQLEHVAQLPIAVWRWPQGIRGLHRRPHRHDFVELVFFERAAGVKRIGHRAHNVGNGTLFLIPEDVAHDSVAVEPGGEGWLLAFRADLLGPGGAAVLRYFGDQGLRIAAPQDASRTWSAWFTRLRSELGTRRLGHEALVRAEVTVFLVELMRLLPQPTAAPAPTLIDRVREFIDRHYAEPISLAEVAAHVRRSPAHVTTVLREHTGATVVEWIHDTRMAVARALLESSDEYVDTIAERVGFKDPKYFTRLFRRIHGVTPTAWRALPKQP